MKKVLMSLLLLFSVASAFCVEDSQYDTSQYDRTVSSSAVTTIPLSYGDYGYRKVYLQNLEGSTTIYMRLDSALTVTTSGYAILPGATVSESYSGAIYLQTEAGNAELRVLLLEK
jgi:hypothetical protein